MMNGGKVEECNVCFFLLRLSQRPDKNEQQALFSNSDYIDHDDHRGDDDDYIHDGGLGHDEETYEGSYGFAQSESCVKQTSETDGRQKQVLAAGWLERREGRIGQDTCFYPWQPCQLPLSFILLLLFVSIQIVKTFSLVHLLHRSLHYNKRSRARGFIFKALDQNPKHLKVA